MKNMKYVRSGPNVWPVEDQEFSKLPNGTQSRAIVEGVERVVDSVHDTEEAANAAALGSSADRKRPDARLDVHAAMCRCGPGYLCKVCLIAGRQARELEIAGAFDQQKEDAALMRAYAADQRGAGRLEVAAIIEACAEVIERGGYTRSLREGAAK